MTSLTHRGTDFAKGGAMLRFSAAFLALAALAILGVGCGSSGSGSGQTTPIAPTPTPTPGTASSGQLVGGTGSYPGPIQGVHFRTDTQSGFTDASGTFLYLPGEAVTFSVADVDFRPAAGAALLSPFQLVAQGLCGQSAELDRLLVFLYSLDQDGNPANGIQVPPVGPGSTQVALSTLTDAEVASKIAQLLPGRVAVTTSAAVNGFITQMDGELWQQTGMDSFLGVDGLERSHGGATDGTNWYFSWELGLQKTDPSYSVLVNNPVAIPVAQAALGDKHIGDIDWWNGLLYVPLEDGSAYRHPFVATYDPSTLMSTQAFALSTAMMTKGVPWVAADGPRSRLYLANWDPSPVLFVLDMTTLTQTATLPLSRTLGRIQGAKVFEGSLYLSTDDAAKDVFKLNLDTGTVIPLFAFNQTFEEEGLVIWARPDGTLMHTLNTNGLGMDFRHHKRTRLPLRQDVCGPP